MRLLHRTAVFCTCTVLCIAAPAPCDAQESTFTRDENGFLETIEQLYRIAPDGTLTLESETGSIQVDSWMNDDVEIRIEKRVKNRREDRARSVFEEIEVVLSGRDDDVHIRIVDNDESIFLRNRVTVEMIARVPERYTLDLSTVDGSIEIKNTKGPVTAITVDGDIEIKNTKSPVTARAVDGDIEIGPAENQVDADTTDGNIEIEEVTGPVTARATDGDIEIRNTRSTVMANAVDGNIDIRHVTGEVNARATDGDIDIRDAQSAVNVDAVDGNIETRTTEGRVDASTLEGDIGLYDTLGAVTARALRGNIDVEVARTNRDSDSRDRSERSMPPASSTSEPTESTESTEPTEPLEPTEAMEPQETTEPLVADPSETGQDPDTRYDLDTTEGDVTIYLPDDITATIEAEGSSGELLLSRLWREDLGHIYSDFGMNKSEWGVFFYVQSEASGDINGGGDRIRLKTNSGNIYIKERRR